MDAPPRASPCAALRTGWLFSEPNPIPLNTALAMCGLARPVFRLPYVPVGRAGRESGAALLRAVQAHIPGCADEVRVMDDHEFVLIGRCGAGGGSRGCVYVVLA